MTAAALFFGYGLVLFAMGLVLWLELRREFIERLTPALLALAGFAFVKAVHEWLQMTQRALAPGGTESAAVLGLEVALVVTIVISSLLLLLYGLRLLLEPASKWLYLLPLGLLAAWLVGVLLAQTPEIGRTLVRAETLGRYLVLFPANIFAAVGTLKIVGLHPEARRVSFDARLAAVLFAANAFFAGLVVPRTRFFPANILNEEVLGVFPVLPSLIRAAIAVGITVAMLRVVRLFEIISENRRIAQNILEHEADLAANIQRQLLPKQHVRTPRLYVHAVQKPAHIVGGDWYDYYSVPDGLAFSIGDASGKGVPAALLSSVAMATLAAEFRPSRPLTEVIDGANDQIVDRFGGSNFATAVIGVVPPDASVLDFVNCGHEPPVQYTEADGVWRIVETDHDLPLGVMKERLSAIQSRSLAKNDKLLFYSDGLHDVRAPDGSFLSMEEVLVWLQDHAELSGEDLIVGLMDFAVRYGEEDIPDDITLLVLERTG